MPQPPKPIPNATDPPATDPPATDPPATGAPATAALCVAALLGSALASFLGRKLPGFVPHAPVFWPLAGVALTLLLRCGIVGHNADHRGGRWGGRSSRAQALVAAALTAGSFAGLLALGESVPLALALSVGDIAAAWAAAAWMRRAGLSLRLDQAAELPVFLGIAILGGAMVSAALTSANFLLAGQISALELPTAWLAGWAGHALGVLLLVVPLLVWQPSDWRRAWAADRLPVSLGLLVAAVALVAGALDLLPVLASAPALVPGLCLTLLAMAALLSLSPIWAFGDLRRREARNRQVLDGVGLGVAEWDLQSGSSFASPQWRELLADRSDRDDDAGTTLGQFLDRVHPENRLALDELLRATPPSAKLSPSVLRLETRLRVRGSWGWFDLRLNVASRTSRGGPRHVVASLADIGAAHGAADRQKLSSNLFMNLHEGLVITDDEMRVLDANPTYTRITGLSLDELLGTVPSLLRSDTGANLSGRVQNAAMWADLHTTGHWVGEVIERRRNGDTCALHVTISRVDGPDGALRYHVLVVSDITEQRLQSERLARQVKFDELTRLPNRAHCSELLIEAMQAAQAGGHLLTVCYLDLDHFKSINQRLGQTAGDRLLAELAIRLRGAMRSRGSTRADVAGRLGGDEFALFMHAGTVEEARFAVERVRQVVAQPFIVSPNGEPTAVTASIGATIYPLDGNDADTLLRHADHAMYGVKQAGRNGILFFDAEHSRRNEERGLAIGRVQEALDQDELMLYYQPKVDLRRGVVLGFEALLRWNHPDRGVVAPAHFLPLIEHTGLSASIGDHVLTRALDQLDAWQGQGLDVSVSVNISARHLQEPDFVQRLTELLARYPRVLGPRLEMEVLETAALTNIGVTSAILQQCASLGVRWALDDFGTGYSTLTYLKRLPVQVLKIDRSFVQNMLTDAQDRAIVEGVISLARTFDCVAVAEGVESAAQARMLLDIGCDIGQGEGIAAPMPASEVAPWVRNWRGLFALAPAAVLANGARGSAADTPR